jgi:hypothetical protein
MVEPSNVVISSITGRSVDSIRNGPSLARSARTRSISAFSLRHSSTKFDSAKILLKKYCIKCLGHSRVMTGGDDESRCFSSGSISIDSGVSL